MQLAYILPELAPTMKHPVSSFGLYSGTQQGEASKNAWTFASEAQNFSPPKKNQSTCHCVIRKTRVSDAFISWFISVENSSAEFAAPVVGLVYCLSACLRWARELLLARSKAASVASADALRGAAAQVGELEGGHAEGPCFRHGQLRRR